MKFLKNFLNLAEILSCAGISSDGLQDIEKVRKIEPDVILSDFIVTNIDGLGILNVLRGEFANDLKNIIISSIRSNKVARRVF